MEIIENLSNVIDVDNEILESYFETLLNTIEVPTIDGLMEFIDENFYLGDLVTDTILEGYTGDKIKLKELFQEYKETK